MAADTALQPARTGIPGLDDILSGGLPRGHIYLVQGDPGVGKTTLALQFLLSGVASGEKGAVHHALRDRLRAPRRERRTRLVPGRNRDPGGHPGDEPDDGRREHALPSFRGRARGNRRGRSSRKFERFDPARVVIDSLSEIRLLAQSTLRYRRQILALKQYFGSQRTTVLLLDDGSADPGDIHLESIAHGVLRMEQLSPLYGAERRRIRVTKLRGTGFRGGFHDMKIKTGGLVVYPRLVASEHDEHRIASEALATGVDGLDRLLGGGLEYGTTTLILGPAGTGKSAIASIYAAAVGGRGERAAMFHFEEGMGTLRQRTTALGIPLMAEDGARPRQGPAGGSGGDVAGRVLRTSCARRSRWTPPG